MVSIAGGEPLVHREIHEIVKAWWSARFVYLCTNAILMQKKMDLFEPSPYFSLSVHIDGLRERHESRSAVTASSTRRSTRSAKPSGEASALRPTPRSSRWTTPNSIREVLDFLNDEVGVDACRSRPGYAYEKAPDQEHWLNVENTRRLFREAFADGRRKKWRLNHFAALPRLPRG